MPLTCENKPLSYTTTFWVSGICNWIQFLTNIDVTTGLQFWSKVKQQNPLILAPATTGPPGPAHRDLTTGAGDPFTSLKKPHKLWCPGLLKIIGEFHPLE